MAKEKLCIYCNKVVLEGFDDVERKYYEKGTKTLHTRERCEQAKGGGSSSSKSNEPLLSNAGYNAVLGQIKADVNSINAKCDQILNYLRGQGMLDTDSESPSG